MKCSKTEGNIISYKERNTMPTTTAEKNKLEYRDFTGFIKSFETELQNYWNITEKDEDIQVHFTESEYLISEYQMCVDISLAFSIQIYGWF